MVRASRNVSIIVQQDENIQFIYICQFLYMFRVVSPSSSGTHIIVSTVSGITETVTATCRERHVHDR